MEVLIKREGVALLITIAFIVAIMAIIGVSLGVVERSHKDVAHKKVLVQSDILLSNMLSILKSASGDINDSTMLDIFLMIPFTFNSSAYDTSVDVSFESSATKVNINWLVPDVNQSRVRDRFAPDPLNPYVEEFLDRILTVYNVSDTILLLSMIADTIDDDVSERVSGSEIVREKINFSHGKIYNMRHFQQILEIYKMKTLDFSVDKIPWQSLIGFTNGKIDFNYISPDVLRYILDGLAPESIRLLTTDKESVYIGLNDLPFNVQDKEKLTKMNIVFFDPNLSSKIVVKSSGSALVVSLDYNLSDKRVSNIEISR